MKKSSLKTSPFIRKRREPELESGIISYQCQNPLCRAEGFYESIHLYEFDDDVQNLDSRHDFCQSCYEEGYRLCLMTYEIFHESKLTQIYDQIYVASNYVINLEDLQHLTSSQQIEEHLKMIGMIIHVPNTPSLNLKIMTKIKFKS